jgi:ketosteroid isomerase-like protein
MSQENVEIVRSLFEAVNRRDYASAVEYVHPEAEIRPGIAGLDTAGPGSGSRLCGRDEVRQYFEDGAKTWETITVEFEEVTEIPDGRVLAGERWRVRGRDGIEVDANCADVYSFRDGLIIRGDGFRDHTEALEAVGLSEQDAHAGS